MIQMGSLMKDKWLVTLSVSCHGRYNQSLEGVELPEGLESLRFGHQYNRSLKKVNLPTGCPSCKEVDPHIT